MRALFIGLVTLVLLTPQPATADNKRSDANRVDVSKLKPHMVVLHDGKGRYIIATPVTKHYSTLFYGNGKTFYKQRTYGGSLDTSSQSMTASFWAPRVVGNAMVKQYKGKWTAQCGKRKTEVKPLAADKASKLIERAVFLKPPWKYQAYALARDDMGTYYYVDRRRDEYGGKGFRLWIGPKGNMKRIKMTNIVSDSEGDIFATKSGQLRFILSKHKSTWVKRKERTELTNVPIRRNVDMIYGDLGVYLGDLGTICDHF